MKRTIEVKQSRTGAKAHFRTVEVGPKPKAEPEARLGKYRHCPDCAMSAGHADYCKLGPNAKVEPQPKAKSKPKTDPNARLGKYRHCPGCAMSAGHADYCKLAPK